MADNRFALIVISSEYSADKRLRRLLSPAKDAEQLEKTLQNPIIGDFNVKVIQNQQYHVVLKEIVAFFKDRERSDLALLYFSGHGIKDIDGNLYLAMSDTEIDYLNATGIDARLINETIRKSRAQQRVLILDCCYSGAFERGMNTKAAGMTVNTNEYFNGKGYAVLTASDAMQYAFEGEKIEGIGVDSLFTRTLIQGLKTGYADYDGDGLVTFDDLYAYLDAQVRLETSSRQIPQKSALGVEGQIIIAKNPNIIFRQTVPDGGTKLFKEKLEAAQLFSRMGFSASASVHALRNHLGVIKLTLQLLKSSDSMSETQLREMILKALPSALERSSQMANLLDSLHEPWKLAKDMSVNVNSCIERALEKTVNNFYGEKWIQLSLQNDLPPVQTLPEMLTEAFKNIIRNAVDALKEKSRDSSKYSLYVESCLKNSSIIEIVIRDNGVGISPENLKRVFEMRFTTKDVGLGFGLFWTRDYIEGLGGNIVVESVLNKGTTFFIRIPTTEDQSLKKILQ